MNLIKNYFYPIIIGVLIIIIIFLRSCSPQPPCPEGKVVTVTKVDTVYKTVEKQSIVYKPGVTKYIPTTVYKDTPIDTNAVLKDYFAKVYYEDTVKIEYDTISKDGKKYTVKLGYILVKDTITENRIKNRSTFLKIEVPEITKTVTNTVYPPLKNKYFGGFDIMGGSSNPINYFGPSLMLENKKEKVYDIGVGISPGGTVFKFGMKWKIR